MTFSLLKLSCLRSSDLQEAFDWSGLICTQGGLRVEFVTIAQFTMFSLAV